MRNKNKRGRLEKTVSDDALRAVYEEREVLRTRDSSWWYHWSESKLTMYSSPSRGEVVRTVELYAHQNNLLEATKKAARQEYERLLEISKHLPTQAN